jgi:hypothetical protein
MATKKQATPVKTRKFRYGASGDFIDSTDYPSAQAAFEAAKGYFSDLEDLNGIEVFELVGTIKVTTAIILEG